MLSSQHSHTRQAKNWRCDLKKKSEKGTQRNVKNTQTPHYFSDPPSKALMCDNCSSQHPKKQCPAAIGKQCRKCNKLNHFAKCHRSSKRKIEAIDSIPKSDFMLVRAKVHQLKFNKSSSTKLSQPNTSKSWLH